MREDRFLRIGILEAINRALGTTGKLKPIRRPRDILAPPKGGGNGHEKRELDILPQD